MGSGREAAAEVWVGERSVSERSDIDRWFARQNSHDIRAWNHTGSYVITGFGEIAVILFWREMQHMVRAGIFPKSKVQAIEHTTTDMDIYFLNLSSKPFCFSVSGSSLLFCPTTAVLRYDDTLRTVSEFLHLDDMQCGIVALNRKKSPGRSATAMPIVGRQKYTTTFSSMEYESLPTRCTCMMEYV